MLVHQILSFLLDQLLTNFEHLDEVLISWTIQMLKYLPQFVLLILLIVLKLRILGHLIQHVLGKLHSVAI